MLIQALGLRQVREETTGAEVPRQRAVLGEVDDGKQSQAGNTSGHMDGDKSEGEEVVGEAEADEEGEDLDDLDDDALLRKLIEEGQYTGGNGGGAGAVQHRRRIHRNRFRCTTSLLGCAEEDRKTVFWSGETRGAGRVRERACDGVCGSMVTSGI